MKLSSTTFAWTAVRTEDDPTSNFRQALLEIPYWSSVSERDRDRSISEKRRKMRTLHPETPARTRPDPQPSEQEIASLSRLLA